MGKTKHPQTVSEAIDNALRYQQYKAIAMFIMWALLYLAAKSQERQAVKP